jgi:sugar lactone lactonase YvrE
MSPMTIQADSLRVARGAFRASGLFPFVFCLAVCVAACSRTAQTAAPPPPPPPLEYVDAWGTHGDGPGQLNAPVAMAADGETNIYIADAGDGYIHKFSTSGEPRLSFQDDRGNLRPVDIAVDAGAAMYVADAHRGTVVIYFSDGMHHRELRVGSVAAVRESLHIGVDAYGTIFATAKRPFGVRKFSTALRAAGSWGGLAAKEAGIIDPSALAVGPDGLIYINDLGRGEIAVYDARGAPQRVLTVPAPAGDTQVDGIAVNAKYVFAVDTKHPTLHIWALDGTYRMSEDLSAWIHATPAGPRKLAVTSAGELFVLDIAATRVFRFRLHL